MRADQRLTTPVATSATLPIGGPAPSRIDKTALSISEPKRLRDKAHLKFVATQPCLICGRQPCDPHHLRFAQPRAIGMKVSDEFTVPLCRGHHRQLHQAGNEVAWWKNFEIDALETARTLWEQTHPRGAASNPTVDQQTSGENVNSRNAGSEAANINSPTVKSNGQ
jgi:hypothetical protein